jgi:hypothetical protein
MSTDAVVYHKERLIALKTNVTPICGGGNLFRYPIVPDSRHLPLLVVLFFFLV